MEKLEEFLQNETFEEQKDIKSFEEGETELNLENLEVEKRTISFDDNTEKIRYVLKDGETMYWAGPQIMQGIQTASEKGAKKVKVLRQGQGLKTKYMVVEA